MILLVGFVLIGYLIDGVWKVTTTPGQGWGTAIRPGFCTRICLAMVALLAIYQAIQFRGLMDRFMEMADTST